MNKEITYSFIIPHRNCPELLLRCIDSIPVRDDVQIIIVDDNSDADKKPSVRRADVEIILLDSAHAKGAGRARNVGLENAKGKWLLFSDSDDYYNPNVLDVLDKYQSREDLDVVYFNFDYIDALTKKPVMAKKLLQNTITNYGDTIVQQNVVKYNNFTPWTKMVRRSFSERYNMFFEEVPNGNDVLYSMMVAYFCRIFVVEPTPIYVYLRQKSSIGHKKHSFQTMKCRIIHLAQVNYFLKSIGIKGTRKPLWYVVLYFSLRSDTLVALRVILSLMKNLKEFNIEKKKWVSIIKSRKNK